MRTCEGVGRGEGWEASGKGRGERSQGQALGGRGAQYRGIHAYDDVHHHGSFMEPTADEDTAVA